MILGAFFYIMCVTTLILILMSIYILTRRNKSVMHYSLLMISIGAVVLTVTVTIQGFAQDVPQFMFWEKLTYLFPTLMPVALILLARAYRGSDKGFSKKSLLLFIVPVITLIVIWTNDFHQLFYTRYPDSISEGITSLYGPYFYVYALYSYVCMIIGFIMLSYYAIRNSGIWSAQAIAILIGNIIPFAVNICYTLKVPGFNAYSTPLAFTFTVAVYLLAMFRFNLLKATPIALQTVINRISDSFIVVDTELNIVDYNKPLIDNFHYFSALRKGENFNSLLKDTNRFNLEAQEFLDTILEAAKQNTTLVKDIETELEGQKQYYTVEFTPISRRDKAIGIIVLFKNISQHIRDMEKIQENQGILLERERLASLGQLIGGIAHNLKTPIMSVAGGIDQLQWLSKEYASSIDDPEVNSQDHKEIAAEMQQWLGKMKMHMGYMSDIISTVKDQASKFNTPGKAWFTIDEMVKRVKILMHHELIKNNCVFKENLLVNTNLKIAGDINSMVQILDNIIVNAIQAYGSSGGEVSMKMVMEEEKLLITLSDNGPGIEDEVKDRLFKEMITTKGKHGTGLGLYMSYSTIKGMFRGNMWFESSVGKGTKFYIQLPVFEEEVTEVGQYA
jgi:two-component system, NtrC family, sensor histidine kinase HupT/HoxJ